MIDAKGQSIVVGSILVGSDHAGFSVRVTAIADGIAVVILRCFEREISEAYPVTQDSVIRSGWILQEGNTDVAKTDQHAGER